MKKNVFSKEELVYFVVDFIKENFHSNNPIIVYTGSTDIRCPYNFYDDVVNNLSKDEIDFPPRYAILQQDGYKVSLVVFLLHPNVKIVGTWKAGYKIKRAPLDIINNPKLNLRRLNELASQLNPYPVPIMFDMEIKQVYFEFPNNIFFPATQIEAEVLPADSDEWLDVTIYRYRLDYLTGYYDLEKEVKERRTEHV